MNLVIFDVDGTLVRTSSIDDVCFKKAVADEWGIEGIDIDWSRYRYSTDCGISRQLYEEHYGTPPDERDISRLQDRYKRLLRDSILNNPPGYVEVTGAAAMLSAIILEKDWKVAVCSGAWGFSASLKLTAAGINMTGAAYSFADDGLHRENIIMYAISRSFMLNDQKVFSNIVYVGDSHWDLRAASNLKLAFVGVEGSGRGGHLSHGAQFEIVKDFGKYEQILRVLCDAKVPSI